MIKKENDFEKKTDLYVKHVCLCAYFYVLFTFIKRYINKINDKLVNY